MATFTSLGKTFTALQKAARAAPLIAQPTAVALRSVGAAPRSPVASPADTAGTVYAGGSAAGSAVETAGPTKPPGAFLPITGNPVPSPSSVPYTPLPAAPSTSAADSSTAVPLAPQSVATPVQGGAVPPSATSSGMGKALALGAAGFFVAGPIGAVVGFFVGSRK